MTTPTRQDLLWADLRRRPDDRRPPGAVVVGVAMMLQLTWVGIGHDLIPHPVLIVGLVLSAAVASVWLTLPAALSQAVLSFLITDGFVDGSYGALTWDAPRDLALLTAFVLACLLAAEAAYDVRWSKPFRSVPTAVETPWWHDDDLVALSLSLPEAPDDATASPAADSVDTPETAAADPPQVIPPHASELPSRTRTAFR